jgi:hypothetical protein
VTTTGQKNRRIERTGNEELRAFNCLVAIPRIFKKRQNTIYGILYQSSFSAVFQVREKLTEV